MSDAIEPLILDLLEWIGRGSRPYAEVLEVWRTSCPRLPVWEEANSRGLLEHRRDAQGRVEVALGTAGLDRLKATRRRPGH